MTTISQIREVLESNNPDTVFHAQTEAHLFCMIPEMGYPFEVAIYLRKDGSILDVSDEFRLVYPDFEAWKAGQVC